MGALLYILFLLTARKRPPDKPINAVSPCNAAEEKGEQTESLTPALPKVNPSEEHDKQTCDCKPDMTPLWKMVLEASAVGIGITLAIIYYRQLDSMNKQLAVMQGRAWIQIETTDITLKNFPVFHLVGTPQDKPPEIPLPGEPEHPYPSIDMGTGTFPITVRNFGNVPARQSVIDASFLILGERPGNDFWGRQYVDEDWDKYACDEAFFVKRYSPGMETPIFPGESEHSIYASRELPIDMSKIFQYAIVVCVAYEDATTGEFHSTSVAYCATGLADRNHLEHVIDHEKGIDGHRKPYSADLYYPPTKQFTRCRADAH
ncbi:MAG TPA: hypothetical protein VJ723_13020 [Candidatus Angelobacter sp.]|nr:hypothetical protein [Candidatus Angelobacter sp.]